jgi:hypothetical protein
VALRWEFLEAAEVTDERRRAAGELLYEVFGVKKARRRGYVLHEPAYLSLVWDGELLVATSAGCLPACEPPLRVYGGADCAVREGWRGRGIVREFNRHTLAQAGARRIDVLLGNTAALGPMLVSNGYRPVRPGELLLERRGKRQIAYKAWYVRWEREPVVPLVLKARF